MDKGDPLRGRATAADAVEPVPVSSKAGVPIAGHTPGPWVAQKLQHEELFELYGYCPEYGTRLLGEFYAEDMGNDLPAMANLTLAAAAPELLQALKMLVYQTTHLSPMEEDGSHWCRISGEALTNARAAIAKTRGEA